MRAIVVGMTDEDLLSQLAALFLEAFEIGGGKQEWDVVDEVFCVFGLDWKAIDAGFPQNIPRRAELLRSYAASQLAGAVPTVQDLLNTVVRCGGRFVSMLDATYARLAQHSASATGASESFRLERAGVDESQLTLSAAFLEQVHHVLDLVQPTPVGMIDESALAAFTRWDNGVSYGQWPISSNDDGIRLVHGVLDLSWLGVAIRKHESADASWAIAASLWRDAHSAAESLVSAAEELIRSHAAHLDGLAAMDAGMVDNEVFGDAHGGWREGPRLSEIRRFRAERSFYTTAVSNFVHGISTTSAVGLDADYEPVVIPVDDYLYGSGVSDLAGFVAMWRLGLWAERERSESEIRLLSDPTVVSEWLAKLTFACQEATAWLANEVLDVTHNVDVDSQIDAIKEFLNLPLWRQRSLLYEVWVLCATLDACEEAGWTVELSGLSLMDRAWVLSVGPTVHPTAKLSLSADETVTLDVWREPLRQTIEGALTPDLTVSTPGPYLRDLLVVEAKDRVKMSVGKAAPTGTTLDQSTNSQRTALGVAQRYARGLHPVATWICNHCDFRQGVDSNKNHGDTWTNIHLADQFRPGQVPAAFTESVAAALRPIQNSRNESNNGPAKAFGLVLLADVTGSMHSRLESTFTRLRHVRGVTFASFRAVLFSDHGDDEPFLVRKLGPFTDPSALVDNMQAQPRGGGGDFEEALEDGIQRCRELVEDIGPQTILVLTDAPPHPAPACPYNVDFTAEVRTLLDLGCQLQVASDWIGPTDPTWAEFEGTDGFWLAPLDTLIASWEETGE